MGSVTSIVVKVPQDQRPYGSGFSELPQYLKSLASKLEMIGGGMHPPGSSIELIDAATYASGTFTVAAGNLSANDTVTIGSQTFTAKASGAVGQQFNIGGSALLTATALAAVVNATAATNVFVSAAVSGTTTGIVTFTVLQPGPLGNQIALSKSATNGSVSGATLSGGSASVTALSL